MTEITAIVRLLVLLLLIALTVILITRRLKIPYTLGLVVVGLLISFFDSNAHLHLTPDLVLFVFLPALLFEGSWAISLQVMRENWLVIFLLAGPALLLEVVLITVPLSFFTILNWEQAFLLAVILSPTDPVAVLGLFRQLRINKQLSTIIEAESLFNDGVAGALYQVFLVLVLLNAHGEALSAAGAWLEGIQTFLLQAGGGVLIGALCGFLINRFVKMIDDPLIETTITIVTAYGVYLLADFLHTSGILAVILAGLILSSGQAMGMSELTHEAVDNFWSVIAFLANALLFLLVGIQLNPTRLLDSQDSVSLLLTAGLAIIAVLAARFVIVAALPTGLPPTVPGKRLRSWRFVIFWSGLRGALSLALVLALPLDVPNRSNFLFATYAVVLFTLLVQGFSLRAILQRLPCMSESYEPRP
ncbi:MAG: sodium:proton antiporter [Ktedonobacteraceae bacterium]|nr:sodium:proton antiporter [Ktedonobacteraceae bacterium]